MIIKAIIKKGVAYAAREITDTTSGVMARSFVAGDSLGGSIERTRQYGDKPKGLSRAKIYLLDADGHMWVRLTRHAKRNTNACIIMFVVDSEEAGYMKLRSEWRHIPMKEGVQPTDTQALLPGMAEVLAAQAANKAEHKKTVTFKEESTADGAVQSEEAPSGEQPAKLSVSMRLPLVDTIFNIVIDYVEYQKVADDILANASPLFGPSSKPAVDITKAGKYAYVLQYADGNTTVVLLPATLETVFAALPIAVDHAVDRLFVKETNHAPTPLIMREKLTSLVLSNIGYNLYESYRAYTRTAQAAACR